jgi:hypothetical protein
METLRRDPTRKTPLVELDAHTPKFRIEGHSIPEDAVGFYEPIFQWFAEFLPDYNGPVELNVALEDFNTASRKCMLHLLKVLSSNLAYNSNIRVRWVCQPDDDDMVEAGEDFAELVEVPIEIVVPQA